MELERSLRCGAGTEQRAGVLEMPGALSAFSCRARSAHAPLTCSGRNLEIITLRPSKTEARHQNVEARRRLHSCCLEARLLPRDIHQDIHHWLTDA